MSPICNMVIPVWDLGVQLNAVVTEFDYFPAHHGYEEQVIIRAGYVVEPGHNFKAFLSYLRPRVLEEFKNETAESRGCQSLYVGGEI